MKAGDWSLPTGWSWARFGDVARIDSELVDPSGFGHMPHIAPNHMESATGRLLPFATVSADGVTSPKHRFRAGHIIYSKIRPYLAKAALVDFEGLCSADCYPIGTDLHAGFLHKWLVSPMFTEAAAGNQGRTVLPKINQEALVRLPVPVPPLAEQRRIVAKLDDLRGRSRRAREALDEVPALLEQLKQSVLAAAFRGDLTAAWRAAHPDAEPATELLVRLRSERRRRWEESNPRKKYVPPTPADPATLPPLPPTWTWAGLEELSDPTRGIPYGVVLTGEHLADGVPTVRCGDIKEFDIDSTKLKRISPQIAEAYERTCLEGGEVLIAIRGTVGATAVAGPHMRGMNISREIAMIPVLEAFVLAPFVMSLMAGPQARRALLGKVKGVAQSGINLSDLRALAVPLPPLAEQVAIVDAVASQVRNLTVLRTVLAEALADIDRLDQSLLAKAFRGELVPQDPDDEPASVLLERLRAARGT